MENLPLSTWKDGLLNLIELIGPKIANIIFDLVMLGFARFARNFATQAVRSSQTSYKAQSNFSVLHQQWANM